MKNYYYVLSFNLTNPIVKSMIARQDIFKDGEMMVDFKVRSRPFMSFTETTIASHKDYQVKHSALFGKKPDEECNVRHICVINPDFMMTEMHADDVPEQFGMSAMNNWSENCCCVLFFNSCEECADSPAPFGRISQSPSTEKDSWMLKYEVMFFDDIIEMPSNGDFVFNVPSIELSTYH